jgi:hypothetical protein
MIPSLLMLWKFLGLTSLVAILPGLDAAEPRPEPFPLLRYQELWETPLFAGGQDTPEAEDLPPTSAAPAYRLLGVGTIRGVDFAYVQAGPGGRIEEVSQNAASGAVLVRVERSASGELRSALIRRDGQLVRATTTASFDPADPAVPPEVPDDSAVPKLREDFQSLGEMLRAHRSGRTQRR